MAKDGINMAMQPPAATLQKRIADFSKEAQDTRKAAKLSSVWMLRSIDDRFKNQGPNDLGVQWKPTSPETLARRVGGGGGGQTLIDTGTMRKSITAEPMGEDTVLIKPGVFYADFHHPTWLTGVASKGKMWNRAFMYFDDKDLKIITEFYQKELDNEATKLAKRLSSKGGA